MNPEGSTGAAKPSGNYKWAGATTARKDQASPGADPLGKVGVTLPGKRLNRNCC